MNENLVKCVVPNDSHDHVPIKRHVIRRASVGV